MNWQKRIPGLIEKTTPGVIEYVIKGNNVFKQKTIFRPPNGLNQYPVNSIVLKKVYDDYLLYCKLTDENLKDSFKNEIQSKYYITKFVEEDIKYYKNPTEVVTKLLTMLQPDQNDPKKLISKTLLFKDIEFLDTLMLWSYNQKKADEGDIGSKNGILGGQDGLELDYKYYFPVKSINDFFNRERRCCTDVLLNYHEHI